MPGVRKVKDNPLRYLVTYSHTQHLDNCQMSLIEQRFDVTDSLHFFFCLKHRSVGCSCVYDVLRYRDDAGLNDKQGNP